MLVKIKIVGNAEDLIPKIDRMTPETREWLDKKHQEKPKGEPMKMNLSEVTKLLTAFNEAERIYFEVR